MGVAFLAADEDRFLIGEGGLFALSETYATLFPELEFACDLAIVTPSEIQELNCEHRGIDEPTDVLSFPTFNSTEEALAAGGQQEALLGSVVICQEKAEAYGETLIQLTHHGLLHLMGYDHEEDFPRWNAEERRILEELETKGISIPPVTV